MSHTRDPGGHSNCVMQVWRWEILLQSAERFQLPQESLSAQKCTGKTFISQCHSIFQFLSLNSKLFGAVGCGGQDGLGNAACSILSNRQGEGKRTAEPGEVSDTGAFVFI